MLVLDLILGAVIALMVLWGFSRGVTVSMLALVGFAAGAVLGSRLAPLVLHGGLHSTYAPEVAIPGALLVGAVSAALFERVVLRWRPRLDRLGVTSPIGGAVLGGALALVAVWTVGIVVFQVRSLRGDVRRSAILSRLDAVLAPPGPPLSPKAGFSDPFPTYQGPSLATGPVNPLVTHTPAVRAASHSVVKVEVVYCHMSKSGTGWIAANGIVATNAHVAAAAEIAVVHFRGATRSYPATPIWFDPKNDIALLRVPGLRGVPALTMVAHSRAGTEGAMIGFPGGVWADRPVVLGGTNSLYSGVLNARETLPREFSHVLFGRLITSFSGRSERGNSGSPVLDRHGRVLGTVFGGGSDTGFAVPNTFVRYALRHAGPQVGTGPCPPGTSP